MATRDYSDRRSTPGPAGERTPGPIPQPPVRGTRIRSDGALKALGIGIAALVALIALPGLLAGEPPPPPDDVGLLPPPPPTPPPAPTSAPPPVPQKPAKPKPAKPKREERSRDERDRAGREDGNAGDRDGREGGGDAPGAPAVAVTAAPSHLPPPAVKESFGFER